MLSLFNIVESTASLSFFLWNSKLSNTETAALLNKQSNVCYESASEWNLYQSRSLLFLSVELMKQEMAGCEHQFNRTTANSSILMVRNKVIEAGLTPSKETCLYLFFFSLFDREKYVPTNEGK